MLDRLKPTAMGLDKLPAWFLRLGAQYLLLLWPNYSISRLVVE